jgi:hypothetical protein
MNITLAITALVAICLYIIGLILTNSKHYESSGLLKELGIVLLIYVCLCWLGFALF